MKQVCILFMAVWACCFSAASTTFICKQTGKNNSKPTDKLFYLEELARKVARVPLKKSQPVQSDFVTTAAFFHLQ